MTSVKYKGEKHTGQEHQSPYPLSRLAPPIDLVELSRTVAEADDMLSRQAEGKLRLLARQMESLQEQAREILLATRESQELHRINCAFPKRPGHAYHVYRRRDGSRFFSLIGPDEWHHPPGSPPFVFVGTYRLEQDQRWIDVTVR